MRMMEKPIRVVAMMKMMMNIAALRSVQYCINTTIADISEGIYRYRYTFSADFTYTSSRRSSGLLKESVH
jgi:hypothetical protein